MTWYASQIFAQPAASPLFTAHPILTRGVYRLEGHAWPDLLIIREICAPNSNEDRWNRGKTLAWDAVHSTFDTPILSLSRLPAASNGNVYWDSQWGGTHPPLPFLRWLKEVSVTTQTPVSYYYHASGAERTADQEYAWVFSPALDCIYTAHTPAYSRVTRTTASGAGGMPLEENRNKTVLQYVLRHFDFELPSAYFAPHTRDFTWEPYRL